MSRYTLRVISRFEAAHHLTSYGGAPEPIHGHSWKVEAVLATNHLGDEGMAYDFVAIKKHLDELTGRFHHLHINDVPPFDQLSPTTERIAAYFFDQLAERLPDAPWQSVTVWEGPLCSATYSP
ncbi:MAG: 6-carboxytetrahydropterin synthase [Acidobacteriota bacterium]